MRFLALAFLFTAWTGPALAVPAGSAGPAPDAVFVRPLYGTYRHCGGACLKSGALSWFCFEKQICYLSCATAPPLMKCAVP